VPIEVAPGGETEEEEPEAEGGNGADKKPALAVVPVEEKPKEPVTPTPSFGGSPPARG